MLKMWRGQGAQRNGRRRLAKKTLEDNKKGLTQGGDADMSDPLAVIPEAVMREYLLKSLEEREDKWNLCIASPSAAKLLKKSQWNWLFQELFRIPNFHYLFSKAEVLNFRLVSRDWRKAVDSFWETANETEPDYKSYESILSSLSTLAWYGQRNYQRKGLCLVPNLAGSTTTKIDKFLHETEIHPGNPFIARVAAFQSFSDGNEENDRNYWKQVLAVLKRFGRELHSMEIRNWSGFTTTEILTILKKCLKNVPQLTTLDLALYSLRLNKPVNSPSSQSPLPVFPPLPNLTSLSISHGKWPIHQQLSIYFDQLVSLNVRNSEIFMNWFEPGGHSTFPKLKHFAVCITNEEELHKLQSLTSPLREIDIKSRLTSVCPSVYLHVLTHFKNTLCASSIRQNFKCDCSIKNCETYGLSEPAQIHLPQLKILSLNITKCTQLLLDQLLKIADSLEYLEVVLEACLCHVPQLSRKKFTQSDKGELQIIEYWNNMYNSNVWRLLPYLQEIHVREGPIFQTYKRSLL